MSKPSTRATSNRRSRDPSLPAGDAAGARLSIGALARATGIPAETLRTWERRYGFPAPERKPSGHRVYPMSAVGRLRRIAEVLARGHRAAEAVAADDHDLGALLDTVSSSAPTPARVLIGSSGELQPFFDALSTFDGERLRRLMLDEWARLGPLVFLEQVAGPLVTEVGDRWRAGSLQVRHEHFLSERLGDVLRLLRQPFEERADGPLVVLTTLPGEAHGLGLQMAALATATSGCRVLYLGTETPIDQIVTVAGDTGARVVAVSVSAATKGAGSRRALKTLRARLPRRVHLLVGGRGAPAPFDHVIVEPSLTALVGWAQRLRETA